MKLRKRDIALAESRRFLSPRLEQDWEGSAQELHDQCEDQLVALGYRFVYKKGPKSWRWKRFTTTMRRRIYLGVGWRKKNIRNRATILAHELVHALQWKGLRAFGTRYVLSTRFRWAVETQAYRESCRAMRAMGMAEQAVQAYASEVPGRLIKGYAILNRRLRKDIRDQMVDIVAAP